MPNWFITHPDVLIDPSVPVPEWPLSERGRARMHAMAAQEWTCAITAIWSSTERKAMDGAEILAQARSLPYRTLETLGENDRSATGYLARVEFEATADAFFAHPQTSIRGWERAIDAQARIAGAVAHVLAESPTPDGIAIIAHGAVGALYLCHLTGQPISRTADQPPGSGGYFFAFAGGALVHGWRAIETS